MRGKYPHNSIPGIPPETFPFRKRVRPFVSPNILISLTGLRMLGGIDPRCWTKNGAP